MGASLQIAKIWGIPIKLHWTFVLMLPLVYFLLQLENFGYNNLIFFSITFVLVSICVILHEYGHAAAAKYYGIETDDIILSPLFGVARIQRLPEKPMGEFIVAFAGPMVNIIIGLILMLYMYIDQPQLFNYLQIIIHQIRNGISPPTSLYEISLLTLIFVNLGLVLFNLIPAFPMDGGRMFRALVHHFTNKKIATQMTMILGQIIALIIVYLSIEYQQYLFILFAFFIYYMATKEYFLVKNEVFREQFEIKQIMRTEYKKIYKDTTLEEIKEIIYRTKEQDLLVFDEQDELVGILGKNDFVIWVKETQKGIENNILKYIREDIIALQPHLNAEQALQAMRLNHLDILPVFDEDTLIGVIDKTTIFEFIEIQKKILV